MRRGDHPADFIIGLDLVNKEDTCKPLSLYADFLCSEEVTKSGPDLFLHCGESLRQDNMSVIDAYLLNTARVGHGFNLYRFPELMQVYAKAGIAIEVCPISNQRLGYCPDLRLHPALLYLRIGLPVVICSDDGLFLAAEPLTDDFFYSILCWDLTLGDIKTICRNSILYSDLPEKDIDHLLKVWEADWNAFIAEYSGLRNP